MSITIFEDAEFGGDSKEFQEDADNLEDFENRASSIIVKGNPWQVFRQRNFVGYIDTFEEGYHKWLPNDQISSLRRVVPSEGFEDPHIILYEHENKGGRKVDIFGSTPDLDWYDFSYKASSYQVVRGAWKLFDAAHYGGAHRLCGADWFGCESTFIGQNWNDVIVSARPIRGRSSAVDAEEPVVLESVRIDWRFPTFSTEEVEVASFQGKNENQIKYEIPSWDTTVEVPTSVSHRFFLDSSSASPGSRFSLNQVLATALDPFPTFGVSIGGSLVSVSETFRSQLKGSFVLCSRSPSRAKREVSGVETLALPAKIPPGKKIGVEIKVIAGKVEAPVEFRFRRGSTLWREKGEYLGEDRTNIKIRTNEIV